MSTTDILFNSPALHSLKRAQLVQLCKRHNIKCSGKNTELVERLKEHARSLPNGDPLNVAIRSEKHSGYPLDDRTSDDASEDEERLGRPQRPSEMWEVVMDDIPEEENAGSIPGSLSSKTMLSVGASGEFGTGGNPQSTISSSIKALATSIGLKRSTSATSMPTSESKDTITSLKSLGKGKNLSSSSRKVLSNLTSTINTRDSLTANAVPYSAIPPSRVSQLPIIEPFAFSYADAADTSISSVDQLVPGVGARTGVDANASNVGMETVRLITAPSVAGKTVPESPALPRLAPIRPAFELVPPTPGLKMWPMSPGNEAREPGSAPNGLYPSLNIEETTLHDEEKEKGRDVEMPGGLTACGQIVDNAKLSPSRPEPFIFGSPHPRHSASKNDFAKAANSVLAEMNARLGLSGTTGAVRIDLLSSRDGKNGYKLSEEEILNYQFGGAKSSQNNHGKDDETKAKGSVGWKFDRAHERAFSKMDGIDTHYAARRGQNKNKEPQRESLAPLPANRKRKSSAIEPLPAKAETGALGLGKGRPSVVRASKRRSSTARVISAGARRKMGIGMGIPGAFGDDCDGDDDDEEGEEGQGEEEEGGGQQAKRVCVERPSEGGRPPKRVSIAPPSNPLKYSGDGEDEEDERIRKQNEAIKRRLEYNKAKRRSSRGRPSIAPRGSLVAQKQKAATSRFGFLASAKSLVKSVWNRGAGVTGTAQPGAAPSGSSSIPVAKPTAPAQKSASVVAVEQKKLLTKPAPASSATTTAGTKPPVPDTKKPSFSGLGAGARPSHAPASRNVSTSSSSNGFLKPDEHVHAMRSGTMRSTSSSMSIMSTASAVSNATNASDRRSRSPIPSFNPPSGDSIPIRGQSAGARKVSASASSGAGVPIFGSTKARGSSMRGPGLMGPPGSVAPNGVGSMGMKPRMRPSSTLYAPTASSLAKTNANLARRSSVMSTNASVASRKSATAIVSPTLSMSRIPVILPLSPRKKNGSSVVNNMSNYNGEASGTGIFSTPLVLPSSPEAKEAERTGKRVNPITGLASPVRSPSNSSRVMPGIEESFGFGVLGEGGVQMKVNGNGTISSVLSTSTSTSSTAMRRNASVLRRPRISRSKVIAKLGAQRAASHSSQHSNTTTTGIISTTTTTTSRPSGVVDASTSRRKGRTRSSVGASAARRSVGGVKARGSGVSVSAKKRARMSEYARRRSAKVAKGVGMEVDD